MVDGLIVLKSLVHLLEVGLMLGVLLLELLRGALRLVLDAVVLLADVLRAVLGRVHVIRFLFPARGGLRLVVVAPFVVVVLAVLLLVVP